MELIDSALIQDFFMAGFTITLSILLPTILGVMAIRLLLKYI